MSLSGRDAYRQELTELARRDERILCIEMDLGGKNHLFEQAHPKRFFNMGIAELATIDIAAGLAKCGYMPFVSTFAPFAVLRAAEGIKLALGYMGANVKIIAPYAGVSGAWFGTTHHCLEDLAVLQSIPGIRLLAPHGETETREAVRWAAASDEPFYIRLGRNGTFTSIPRATGCSLEEPLWDGDPSSASHHTPCLVSVGEMGTELCRSVRQSRPDLPHAHLCAVDSKSLAVAVTHLNARFRDFIVVEEHRRFGGIGSSLALLMPQGRVFSLSCGELWPKEGGDHEDVLATLGFGLAPLFALIDDVERQNLHPRRFEILDTRSPQP